MSNSIIEVNNLSKSYTISHEGREHYTALRDVMAQKAKKIFSFPRSFSAPLGGRRREIEEFWALKDVSFKIEQGDRVGIIGRNGAGKSTLLKILSRITEPTSGEIKIKGRVASLLEVGTGFHPELTGRENIFLNGAILGMSRVEIKKHFDAIVDFAEVEKFLDTPVKRYSSGMYVRLAFAVAAHLEPEILVVDEVLAVGDAQFQKKCLGKMEDVSVNEGRTVIFVSHNMPAIRQLCSSCIFIENGRMMLKDKTVLIVERYLNQGNVNSIFTKQKFKRIIGSQIVIITGGFLTDNRGNPKGEFSIGDDVFVNFNLDPLAFDGKVKLAIQLRSSDGINLANMIDSDSNFNIGSVKAPLSFSIKMRDIRLYPDTYYISIWAGSENSIEVYDHVEDCLNFQIIDGGLLTSRTLPRIAGLLFYTPEWEVRNEGRLPLKYETTKCND